jgi:hypothetical protein
MSMSPPQMARACSVQLSHALPAEHWTTVVGRPSLVKSGALPPHPATIAAHAVAATAERTIARTRALKRDVSFISKNSLA